MLWNHCYRTKKQYVSPLLIPCLAVTKIVLRANETATGSAKTNKKRTTSNNNKIKKVKVEKRISRVIKCGQGKASEALFTCGVVRASDKRQRAQQVQLILKNGRK